MKKLFFLAVLALGTMTAQAQTAKKACSKKCTKKASCTKAKSATDSSVDSEAYRVMMVSATDAAAADENIEKRVCAKSGKVSFAKKSVCPASGKVSYTDVKYCTKSEAFVNVSPVDMEAQQVNMTEGAAPTKKACAKKCSKTCAKKAATATEAPAKTEEMPKATKVSIQG